MTDKRESGPGKAVPASPSSGPRRTDAGTPHGAATTERQDAGASTPHPLAGSVVANSSGLPGQPVPATEDGRLLPEERLLPGSRPPRPR